MKENHISGSKLPVKIKKIIGIKCIILLLTYNALLYLAQLKGSFETPCFHSISVVARYKKFSHICNN